MDDLLSRPNDLQQSLEHLDAHFPKRRIAPIHHVNVADEPVAWLFQSSPSQSYGAFYYLHPNQEKHWSPQPRIAQLSTHSLEANDQSALGRSIEEPTETPRVLR